MFFHDTELGKRYRQFTVKLSFKLKGHRFVNNASVKSTEKNLELLFKTLIYLKVTGYVSKRI